jgi:hypothetical protein
MRIGARFWLLGTLVGLISALGTPAALGAVEFGVVPGSFQSGACDNLPIPAEDCKMPATQAGEHPVFSFSTFTFNTEAEVPVGPPRRIRLDATSGFITNPHAVPTCTSERLGGVPGGEKCPPGSQIGFDEIVIYNPSTKKDGPPPGEPPTGFPVYNMEPPLGSPSDFAFLTATGRVDLVGGVSWHKEAVNSGVPTGDSHEFYVISNIFAPAPLVSSTLILLSKPSSVFLTVPTSCTGPPTTYLEVESYAGEVKSSTFNPAPLQTLECATVPFAPAFAVHPETTQSDLPDGLEVGIEVPQSTNPLGRASSHVRTVQVTLPEGMTLNPSAAHGIEGCTPEQVEITPAKPTNTCPSNSKIGTVTVETPAVLAPRSLPAEHEGVLSGNIYLGKPAFGPITGPPYTIYLSAETSDGGGEHHVGGEYGVGLVQMGTVVPNEATGRLTTTFAENAQSPFSHSTMRFNGGVLAPLANPLVCGLAVTTASLAPWSGNLASVFTPAFTVGSNDAGGACPSPLPFSLGQSTEDHPATGGANANFTLNLARADGQQYLSKASATLPEGLVGKIPAVPLCPEPQATQGTCPSTSQIGTATVTVGSGGAPTQFSGPVYLTGPTGNAPYGMTVVIDAAIGPFSLGPVVVRAGIEVNPFTARVTVASALPTIVKGIPLRLRTMSVAINRQGFLINPTNCGVLATETLLTSTFGSTQLVSTPFQASGCGALPFKPRLTASTSAKASRRFGAALTVKVGYPVGPQANIKSVFTQLPKQLPSRLSTLKGACAEAVFNANPMSCPNSAFVGGAKATTPVLPGALTGPAVFVSHGGAAFPDLDIVLKGANGITIILVGNTNITKGITTTTFASTPDVPVSGFELKLPAGQHSALAANGNLCAKALVMPTTITAQNGAVIKQSTRISVSGCGVRIVSRRVRDHRVILRVQVPSAGRVSAGGRDLSTVRRRVRKAGTITLSVHLSRGGLRALANARRHHRSLKVRVRVGFVPTKGRHSTAFATVRFR